MASSHPTSLEACALALGLASHFLASCTCESNQPKCVQIGGQGGKMCRAVGPVHPLMCSRATSSTLGWHGPMERQQAPNRHLFESPVQCLPYASLRLTPPSCGCSCACCCRFIHDGLVHRCVRVYSNTAGKPAMCLQHAQAAPTPAPPAAVL
jgi:hypothetical protein